jgi:hypothetical protein
MIFDHRTYNIKPNRLATFLETYERVALPVQRNYLAIDNHPTGAGSWQRRW